MEKITSFVYVFRDIYTSIYIYMLVRYTSYVHLSEYCGMCVYVCKLFIELENVVMNVMTATKLSLLRSSVLRTSQIRTLSM